MDFHHHPADLPEYVLKLSLCLDAEPLERHIVEGPEIGLKDNIGADIGGKDSTGILSRDTFGY
jgi:hypothetical protein